MLIGYVGAAMLRASIVGSLVYLVASLSTGFKMAHPGWVLAFSVSGCFACLGLMAALWAEKFDHLSIFPNFVLTPLTFLGGVFYSVDMLPEPWGPISRANPILYMVNGLRYGLLGGSDMPIALAFGVLALFILGFYVAALWMLKRGVGIRS